MSDSAQISGRVFRYLSSMHGSLKKNERERYRAFEPEQTYPWTSELAGELTELVKRAPRETAFAKGFAYASQRGIPEGSYVPVEELLANIDRLPSAWEGTQGSGFTAEMQGNGHALVRFDGMPGFKNVCIAVVGELGERLKSAGAKGLEVRHLTTCRLQGGDVCEFEVRWSQSVAPTGAVPADLDELLEGRVLGGAAAAAGEPGEEISSRAAQPAARPASVASTVQEPDTTPAAVRPSVAERLAAASSKHTSPAAPAAPASPAPPAAAASAAPPAASTPAPSSSGASSAVAAARPAHDPSWPHQGPLGRAPEHGPSARSARGGDRAPVGRARGRP